MDKKILGLTEICIALIGYSRAYTLPFFPKITETVSILFGLVSVLLIAFITIKYSLYKIPFSEDLPFFNVKKNNQVTNKEKIYFAISAILIFVPVVYIYIKFGLDVANLAIIAGMTYFMIDGFKKIFRLQI